jgi:uncharacterized protein (TIGR01370 family)
MAKGFSVDCKEWRRFKMSTFYKRISCLLAFSLFFLTALPCQADEKKNNGKSSVVLNGISISTWMYQLQWLDDKENIDMLDNTDYDMMVVEPGLNFTEEPFDAKYLVSSLKHKPNGDERIVLAYIDIGQAEDYRTYWKKSWVAPTKTKQGKPGFLITIDPDGWSGNYPVAYWDDAWQRIWLSKNGLIKQIAELGFDGIYLDWVEAYDDDKIREAAASDNVNPENEMMFFIKKMRDKGKKINSQFLVVPQNAPYLLDINPKLYTSVIDALATEDTWFYGEGDAPWDDSDAGDLKGGERHAEDYSTKNRIAQNKKYLKYGLPVFTIDYCISKRNAKKVYKKSRENGFIPLVTRVSLSKITETPPF